MLLTRVLSGVAALTCVFVNKALTKAMAKTPLFFNKDAVLLALPRPKARGALWVRVAQRGCAFLLRLSNTKTYSTIAVKSIVISSSFAKVSTLTVNTFAVLASVGVTAPVKLTTTLSKES